jgi:hypothetical protein
VSANAEAIEADLRPRPVLDGAVHEALKAGLAEFKGPDGVRAGASTWIVWAVNPAA